MDPPKRKRHHHHHHHYHRHQQQQMEANEEVNGIINHLPTAADGNNNNNHNQNNNNNHNQNNNNNQHNNNNNEESGWKMAALEARNRMLEVTLEYNGLRAENLALRGKTKTLEAEQAVQLENAEKFGEFLQKLMSLQEQNRMEIAVLKGENCEIWGKLKEAEQKEEQQRKEIDEQKVLNQAGTKALWRQVKEAEQKFEVNQNNLDKFTKRMASLEEKQQKEMSHLKNTLGEFTKKMASLEEKQEMKIAYLKKNFADHTKRMEQQQQNEISDLKVKNMQLEASIQHNLREFIKMMTRLEEKQEMKIADLQDNLAEFTKRMASLEQKQGKKISDLNLKNNLEKFTKRMEKKHKKKNADLKNNFEQFTKMEEKHKKEIADLKNNLEEFTKRIEQKEKQVKQIGQVHVKVKSWQDKRLVNPKANGWNPSNTKAQISPDGHGAISSNTNTGYHGWHNVFASEAFAISAAQCRQDFYPGTILYYFEATKKTSSVWAFYIGLANGHIPDNGLVQSSPNYYCFPTRMDHCYMAGQQHKFEWPTDAIRPEWKGIGDTLGCGILMNPKNELAIFFTANGILMGKQIPLTLKHPCDFLIPTVSMKDVYLQANFGHDLATKPFKYDTEKWPGLDFHQ